MKGNICNFSTADQVNALPNSTTEAVKFFDKVDFKKDKKGY